MYFVKIIIYLKFLKVRREALLCALLQIYLMFDLIEDRLFYMLDL